MKSYRPEWPERLVEIHSRFYCEQKEICNCEICKIARQANETRTACITAFNEWRKEQEKETKT